MAKEFTLSVVAPDKSVAEERVESVVAPGVEGYFGVMADHLPMIAALKPGLLEYTHGGGNRSFVYLGGGFAEIRNNRMIVLADEAQRASDIDIATAEAEVEAARRALRGEGTVTSTDAVADLDRAMNRLKAARTSR